MVQSLLQSLSFNGPLIGNAVECLQSFLIVLHTLDEGFLIYLPNDRLHILLNIPLHQLDLLGSL
jgi:hypothetical protein